MLIHQRITVINYGSKKMNFGLLNGYERVQSLTYSAGGVDAFVYRSRKDHIRQTAHWPWNESIEPVPPELLLKR